MYRRSDLLLLAGNDAVRQALWARSLPESADVAVLSYLRGAFDRLQPAVERVRWRDEAGRVRWMLRADPARVARLEAVEEPASPPVISATSLLPVAVPVMDEGGARLGTLEADVRTASLLPAGLARGAPAASVLGVIDRRSGASLLPTPFDPVVLEARRFEWDAQRWLVVRRSLAEPPVDLVLASPLDPYVRTFGRTAGQGALALAAVALAGCAMAAVLARRLARSMERLVDAAEAVARGDLDRRVEVALGGGGDEVGRLARVFNDMTESLRRTLAELSQRQALAAVGEFAAALAHEVRNPLTAIRIDLQRIEEKLLPADARLREPLADVLAAVHRLDRTVSGSLRIARSGRISLEPVELAGVLESARRGAAPEFLARGAAVEPPPPEADGVRLRGDAAALGQLFLNLLLNAAQALGPGGRAGIAVASEPTAVAVSVWDTGPGIPASELPRIFEPFYTTRPDGTGLGMAIAQRIAAAHGGEIRVESTPGVGTCVEVRLPTGAAGGPAPAHPH
jgi:signal transduction histidine kinase